MEERFCRSHEDLFLIEVVKNITIVDRKLKETKANAILGKSLGMIFLGELRLLRFTPFIGNTCKLPFNTLC